ncbi:NmrA-like family protein [Xylaria palmicola]|nr:NmrA-like family protein [Xylaria palmicola]
MEPIKKVAIFGAAGNFGAPITSALVDAGFAVTAVTRPGSASASASALPPGLPVIRADYADEDAVAAALAGQDAVVCVLGPGAVGAGRGLVDAAARAGVRRYIINDFGWGLNERSLPEFQPIGEPRKVAWDRAVEHAQKNDGFTWTGITIGNPIDWALAKFPRMGFNIAARRATIYDAGAEEFTGTTLEGIGQSVVGVLARPAETANRFVRVRSIRTSQGELLAAFRRATVAADAAAAEWEVEPSTAQAVLDEGRAKHAAGAAGWALDLLVYQLYAPGEARCVVASSSGADSDSALLGVREESADEVVEKALARARE